MRLAMPPWHVPRQNDDFIVTRTVLEVISSSLCGLAGGNPDNSGPPGPRLLTLLGPDLRCHQGAYQPGSSYGPPAGWDSKPAWTSGDYVDDRCIWLISALLDKQICARPVNGDRDCYGPGRKKVVRKMRTTRIG